MTGDELVVLLREGADQENRKASYGSQYGIGRLEDFELGADRDDADSVGTWRQYERLVSRFYHKPLVTVSEDGTRLPWSPDRLGSVAP